MSKNNIFINSKINVVSLVIIIASSWEIVLRSFLCKIVKKLLIFHLKSPFIFVKLRIKIGGRGGMVDTTDLKPEQQSVSSQIQKKN